MAGSNIDGFEEHVKKMDDGIFSCVYCRHSFVNGATPLRIIWHLSKEEGHGVPICGQVHEKTQAAMHESLTRKKQKMAGSNRDEIWKYALQMDDGSFNCVRCGYSYGDSIAISRINLHLSRECLENQKKTMDQRRKGKEMAPSKSGRTSAISASEQEQNNVDMAQQREHLFTGEIEQANDLSGGRIEFPREKGSKYRDMVDYFKSGWTLLLTNLILELASAVFDQLDYALGGMVVAFVDLLLTTAELIHMARKGRMRPSTSTVSDTIAEYLGLVGAAWQCVYSTVEYAYPRQKKDNPIMSFLPFILLSCVAIYKLVKKE